MEETENQELVLNRLRNFDVGLFIKREDKIHPQISGNKYRKLKYNIAAALAENKKTLLSFGGAFSNHISAVAAVGKMHNLKTIGIIRGEELGANPDDSIQANPTLQLAEANGMRFKFVSRTDYRLKKEAFFIDQLKDEFGDFYLIPEGGTNALAIKGCEEILKPKDQNFDFICAAMGTGGTLAGLVNSAGENQTVLGFSALKGDFLKAEVDKFTIPGKKWSFIDQYHFGGFAKVDEEIITFINDFKLETNIALDPVYTGKMMYGIVDLIEKGYFFPGAKILAVHTGGLQGIAGMNTILAKKRAAYRIL